MAGDTHLASSFQSFSAGEVSPAMLRLLAGRVDVTDVEKKVTALRTAVASEITPEDIEDEIVGRRFPVKHMRSMIAGIPQYLTMEGIEELINQGKGHSVAVSTPKFECQYWQRPTTLQSIAINYPFSCIVSAMTKCVCDEEARKLVVDFFESLRFSEEDKKTHGYPNTRQKLYRELKSAVSVFCSAKANSSLFVKGCEGRVSQIPYGELLLGKILMSRTWPFDELVRAFTALGGYATLSIEQFYIDGYRYRYGNRDYDSKQTNIWKRLTKAEFIKDGRAELERILGDCVSIRRNMVRYTQFDFGSLAAFFGKALTPISQLVEATAMAKVNEEAQFLLADFENFCRTVVGAPDESMLRDNKMKFKSSFGVFQFEFDVTDVGIITKLKNR